ncbi:MmcQ/YjbR family DNA-binding protein [Jannaschia faecimaris]|uniref:MmcQ/YjbR family DNA-binding protein n=1 Tax=Jannaschia faecimaris TaxID=1244108 RepID=UPI003CC79F0D
MPLERSDIDALCSALPSANPSGPGEFDSWKLAGRTFVAFGGPGGGNRVSVKCADKETAAMLIDAGVAVRSPSFGPDWVRLPYATTEVAEAEHRIRVSYDTIRANLPKATREAL